MKKRLAIPAVMLLISLSVSNCKKVSNVNPNLTSQASPNAIMPQLLNSMSGILLSSSFSLGNEVMQYTAMFQSIWEEQRFIFTTRDYNFVWSLYNSVRNIDEIIHLSEGNPALSNYVYAASILRAYLFATVTDTYGDVPYFEAGKAPAGIYEAPYDKQKDIYADILTKLETANDSLDVNEGFVLGGDRMFNGTVLKWKKFANSLRLRLLMRVSGKPEMNSAAKIAEIFSNTSRFPLMVNNDDNAKYTYGGTNSDIFPYSSTIYADNQFKYYIASAFLVDSLKKFGDTRLAKYARPTSTSPANAPEYVGLPSGLPIDQSLVYNGGPANMSYLGTLFQTPTGSCMWMSYSELLFIKAEAVMRGYIAGNAKDLYESAIKASFEYWGAAMPAGYLTQPGVTFDGSYAKLFLQKYYALFFTGMEGWFEYKRTGFPAIVPGPANTNNGKIPSRIPYPVEEQSLNKENYQAQLSAMGGTDDMNNKMWWQP